MVSAVTSQKVCGAACRQRRNRKLARRRRRADLQDHRADDRERQRECRARREREVCHAPPSNEKAALLAAGMRDTWDEIVAEMAAVSRATLSRRISRLARLCASPGGTENGP